jgi:hypothetical protein
MPITSGSFPRSDFAKRERRSLYKVVGGNVIFDRQQLEAFSAIVETYHFGRQRGKRKTREALAVAGFRTSSDVRGRGVGPAGIVIAAKSSYDGKRWGFPAKMYPGNFRL